MIPPYPEYENPSDKFRRRPEPCAPGARVIDSEMRVDGVMVCSGCRREMEIVGETWVHAGGGEV